MMMRRALCILCLCVLLPGLALADIGRPYEEFERLYAENILFINSNVQRHLLPFTPTRDYTSAGRRFYRIQGGALYAEIHMDAAGEQVAGLRIVLTAPPNMAYGDREYNDFAISGYQSYALLMAMALGATPAERYALVEQVNNGLKDVDLYETQVGDYYLTCTRSEDEVTLLFENALLMNSTLDELERDSEDDYIG